MLDGLSTPDKLDGTLDNKGYTGHEMLDGLRNSRRKTVVCPLLFASNLTPAFLLWQLPAQRVGGFLRLSTDYRRVASADFYGDANSIQARPV